MGKIGEEKRDELNEIAWENAVKCFSPEMKGKYFEAFSDGTCGGPSRKHDEL